MLCSRRWTPLLLKKSGHFYQAIGFTKLGALALPRRLITSTMIDGKELKDLVKATLAEALEEQRALVKEIVEEAIEEIALTRTIDEGLKTKPATRDEVFHVLERTH